MEGEEKVKTIQERLQAAQSRQKRYADRGRRELYFKVGDFAYLKVTPFKGTQRFQEKGKITPFGFWQDVGLSPINWSCHNLYQLWLLPHIHKREYMYPKLRSVQVQKN